MKNLINLLFFLLLLELAIAGGDIEISAKPSNKINSGGRILVEFKNKSNKQIRIWKWQYSWGWDNINIVVIKNKKSFFFRKNINPIFTKNYPDYFVINPNESITMNIDLYSHSWISSDEEKIDVSMSDAIIITYTVQKTDESSEYKVWTGISSSLYTTNKITKDTN